MGWDSHSERALPPGRDCPAAQSRGGHATHDGGIHNTAEVSAQPSPTGQCCRSPSVQDCYNTHMGENS